jgi:hypothetical protein
MEAIMTDFVVDERPTGAQAQEAGDDVFEAFQLMGMGVTVLPGYKLSDRTELSAESHQKAAALSTESSKRTKARVAAKSIFA